jgi:hypothetical protein
MAILSDGHFFMSLPYLPHQGEILICDFDDSRPLPLCHFCHGGPSRCQIGARGFGIQEGEPLPING